MPAIVNAQLHTMVDDGVIDNGDIVFRDGEISEVGTNLDIPSDERVIDAEGRPVTPGLIDPHSHSGTVEWGAEEDVDWDEYVSPTNPQVSVVDGYHPRDEELERSIRGGVTSLGLVMGSANVIGGVGCVAKTHGHTADEMVIRENSMKAALGQNPKGSGYYEHEGRYPDSRPGIAATLRQAFVDAEDYLDGKKTADENGNPFERDIGLENLGRMLQGELMLRVHAHRADDICTAFRIAEEFDLLDNLVIEHATEGHLVADQFVKHDVPAVVGPSFYSGNRYELKNITLETAAALHEAGVQIGLMTDAPVLPQQYLNIVVGLSIRGGLPEEVALEAVTSTGAEINGVEDRIGTLEPGTDADIVVWNGPMFEIQSRADHVVVNGDVVYDRDGALD